VNPDGLDPGAGDAVPVDPETDASDVDASDPDTDAVEAVAPDIFDGLVLDEAFVLAALIHEPSAEERLKKLRAGAKRRGRAVTVPPRFDPGAVGLSTGVVARRGGRYQAAPARWHRVVARVMLVVIGLLAILVAAAAVYRGAGPSGQQAPRSGTGGGGSASSSRSGAAGSSAVGLQR
jgi:hypothetical protein